MVCRVVMFKRGAKYVFFLKKMGIMDVQYGTNFEYLEFYTVKVNIKWFLY